MNGIKPLLHIGTNFMTKLNAGVNNYFRNQEKNTGLKRLFFLGQMK